MKFPTILLEAVKRYSALMLPKLIFKAKQELLRLFVNKIIVNGKQLTIQRELPMTIIDLDYVSESSISSNSGVGSSASRS